MRPISVSASKRWDYRLWPLVSASLFILSVFRRIRMLAKIDYLLR